MNDKKDSLAIDAARMKPIRGLRLVSSRLSEFIATKDLMITVIVAAISVSD